MIFALAALCAGFEVVGYLPEYRYDRLDWDIVDSYTVLIFFSIEVDPNGRLTALDRLPKVKHLEKMKGKVGKRLISIGGANRSNNLGQVVVNVEKRKRLVKELTMLVEGTHTRYTYLKDEIHGVDLNFESPASEKQWKGLSRLASSLNMNVTVAYHPLVQDLHIKKQWKRFQHVTWFHAMAYNRPGPSFAVATNAVQAWQAQDLPFSKMVLGIPFYGHVHRDVKTYKDIVDGLSAKEVRKLDGVDFDGVSTVRQKVQLARSKGLAGVMAWEVGQDVEPSHPLSLSRLMGEERNEL